MIAYLRGKVLTTTLETVILDVNGVGYEIYCSRGAFRKTIVGEVAELHTYLQVKEDGMTLFGFDSVKEKSLNNVFAGENAKVIPLSESSSVIAYSLHCCFFYGEVSRGKAVPPEGR